MSRGPHPPPDRNTSLLPATLTVEQRLAEIDHAIAAEQRRLLSTGSLSLQQVRSLKADVHKRVLSLQARRRAIARRV